MKNTLHYLITAIILFSLTGCTEQSFQEMVDKSKNYINEQRALFKKEQLAKEKALLEQKISEEKSKPIKHSENIYEFSKEKIDFILQKKVLTKRNKTLIDSLNKMNIVMQNDNNYTFNILDKVSTNQIFDSISHTSDGRIAVTKVLKKNK